MKTVIFIAFTFLLFVSCKDLKHEVVSDDDIVNNFTFDNFQDLNFEDTLIISARFSECGEWGGHDETMKLFYEKDRETVLKFKRNKIKNCNERNDKGEIIKSEALVKEIVVSKVQKEALMVYINKMMKSKFLDRNFSNAGNSFSIESTNENFKITTYNNHVFSINSYDNLLETLNIPHAENYVEEF